MITKKELKQDIARLEGIITQRGYDNRMINLAEQNRVDKCLIEAVGIWQRNARDLAIRCDSIENKIDKLAAILGYKLTETPSKQEYVKAKK